MVKRSFNLLFACLLALGGMAGPLGAKSPESTFSAAPDRRAIETLLATYTKAVTTRTQALFETLLLGTDIPFYYVSTAAWRLGRMGSFIMPTEPPSG
jgi:hypothetical protein